jgi:hypothetical protein
MCVSWDEDTFEKQRRMYRNELPVACGNGRRMFHTCIRRPFLSISASPA